MNHPPPYRLPVTAGLLVATVKLLTGSSVRWVGCQPDTRQRVYFANHTSHLDPVVLWAALRRDSRALTRPVAARDYWMAGAVRRALALRVFNAMLIDRHHASAHDNNPIEQLAAALGERHSLILFPEGTRGSGREPGAFKSGLYHLAKRRPDVELVPVYIDNMNRILPKGELLPVPLLGSVSFGAPIRLEPEEPKVDFLHRARGAVLQLQTA